MVFDPHLPPNSRGVPALEVAYVISEYPSLSHTFILREIRALRRLGVHVHVFSLRYSDFDLSQADREEVAATTSLRPVNPFHLLRALGAACLTAPSAFGKTLWTALRRGQTVRGVVWQFFYFVEAMLVWYGCQSTGARHVHAHFANAGADVARLTASYGNQRTNESWDWSFTVHGPADFVDAAQNGLAWKVAEASFVVCISDFARAQIQSLLPHDRWQNLLTVHCGVHVRDRQLSRPVRQDGTLLRVLCVGRLVPVKNYGLVLEAAALLRSAGPRVVIRIVGSGPAQTDLETVARQLGVLDDVRFIGPVGQDDMDHQWDWADVLCVSSSMEGVPVVLMEAMERGLAVVTTAVAGVPELVVDGESGLLVRPGRADLLAGAFSRLASDPQLRVRLGESGRDKVAAEFDVNKNAEILLKGFLHQAAGRREAI